MVSNMNTGFYRVVTTRPAQVPGPDGGMMEVPAGTTLNRVVYDPAAPWTPPEGTQLLPDDGVAWRDSAQPAPVPVEMDAYAWLQRLPPEVQVSVARAAQADPRLLVGLTLLGARGSVDLSDPHGTLRGFLDLAVAATAAMPNPLTRTMADRMLVA
jgi:hypothetical protein